MRSTKAGSGSGRRSSKAASADNGTVGEATQALTTQALGKVAEVSQQLQAQGESFLSTQKTRAAEGIRTVGQSIRESAASLQEGPLSEVSEYVEAAADGLDRASRYLVEQDWRTLREDAEEAARRQPAWFLGGMFVLGFAAARFLKSTGQSGEGRGSESESREAGRSGRARGQSERRGSEGRDGRRERTGARKR